MVDENFTRKAAELARLELTEAEVKVFSTQLQQILGYVDQILEVNTSVEPLVHPIDLMTSFREDCVQDSSLYLDHSPDGAEGNYQVPPIL